MAIPFNDHLIMELQEQFSDLSVKTSSVLGLVPSVMCKEDACLDEAASMYKDDLPSPDILDMNVERWKHKFHGKDPDAIPDTCAKALTPCDRHIFPSDDILYIACYFV